MEKIPLVCFEPDRRVGGLIDSFGRNRTLQEDMNDVMHRLKSIPRQVP